MIKKYVAASSVLLALLAHAYTFDDEDDKNKDKPETVVVLPSFDVQRLLKFDVTVASSMVFGVDPETLSITEEGIVRYVLVATSASGVRNVMYEGIRCKTSQAKTYARFVQGKWETVNEPQWRHLLEQTPSRHAAKFASAAACDGPTPTRTAQEMVTRLKQGDSFRR